MLIAITAMENSLQSEVDPRFGRAAYYMIVNTDTGEVKAHDNSDGINASNGAGTGAAQRLSEYGVEALYTGRVGPKAADVLDKANIVYYENMTGTIQAVLDQLSGDDESAGKNTQKDQQPRENVIGPTQRLGFVPGSGRGLGMGTGRGQGLGRGMGTGRGRGLGKGQGQGLGRGKSNPVRTDQTNRIGEVKQSSTKTGYRLV